MTNPQDSGPGKDPQNGPHYGSGGQDYPAYPQTNHPEDQPGFGAAGAGRYPGYEGFDGDTPSTAGFGGAGYAGADAGLPADGDLSQQHSDGKISITDAIGWGFQATFRNWSLWIILGLLGFIVTVVIPTVISFLMGASVESSPTAAVEAFSRGGDLSGGIVSIIAFFLTPLIYNAALWTMRRSKVGWSSLVEGVNYFPTLLMSLLVGVISSVIVLASFMIPLSLAGLTLSNLTSFEEIDDSQLLAFILGVLGAILVMILVSIAVQPFVALWPYVVADRQESFGKAISRGFSAGKRNWIRLIGLSVLLGLMLFVGALIAGLGLIIMLPVMANAQAYAYRQAIGETVPKS